MKNALILTGAMAASTLSAHAAATLISDNFSSGTFTSGTKFTNTEVDSGWHKRSSNGPAWSISGGALTNPQLVNNDDKPAFILNTVSSADTTLTKITVTFDYSVAAGSTLFFHAALMTGALGTLDAGVSNSDGSYAGDQYSAGFVGGSLNLKDGTVPTSNDMNAIASFVGSAGPNVGTFTQTYDISGYTGINDITDVSHILAVFSSNNNEPGGAISIDNFNVTAIPEPSATALLGLGGLALILRRRRA